MPTKLITKNSSTASAVPTAGQLDQGELAVNVTDKRLFTKDSGGTVRELGTNPTSVTTPTINNSTGVSLQYNGSTKAATTSTGIDVTGTVVADGLTVAGNSYVGAGNYFTDNTSGYFFGGDGNYDAGIFATGTTLTTLKAQSNIAFTTASTERMRIDSSGNLLVGTTDTNPAGSNVLGAAIRPSGFASSFTGEGGQAINLNRKANDGNIAVFHKDGTTVGSIGTQGGDKLTIGNGDVGVAFNPNADSIYPWNTATNGLRDGGVDLGYSDGGATNIRFRNLYLSGGVYLGGTGAANHLDDYEEGTFTATLTDGTTNQTATGQYTKVGRLVYVSMSFSNLHSGRTFVGTVSVTGLPFAAAAGGQLATRTNYTSTGSIFMGEISTTTVLIRRQDGTYQDNVEFSSSDIDTFTDLRISGNYTIA